MIAPDPEVYPRRVAGHHGQSRCAASQVDFLIGLLPAAGRFLEVGSASGVTAALIADARPGAGIVCVDNYDGAKSSQTVMDRLVNWRGNQRPNMALWLGDLGSLAAWIDPAARFDVAFVDADHTYDCTRRCLDLSAPLVRPGGRIVAHDWLDPNWPEVESAVRDFAAHAGWAIVAEARHICALESRR